MMMFACSGGSVWGAGQQSEAVERQPHHFQAGAALHSGMGSLQRHSDCNYLYMSLDQSYSYCGFVAVCWISLTCSNILWMPGVQVDPKQSGEQRHPRGEHASFWYLDGVGSVLVKAEQGADGHRLLPGHILRWREDRSLQPVVPG